MRIYSVPILCSPQIIPVVPDHQVLGLQAPSKKFPHAKLIISKSSSLQEDPGSFVSLTCSLIPLPDFTDNVDATDVIHGGTHNCGSLLHYCESPVRFQEARMLFVGSYVHYYSKIKYAVYFESLTGGSGNPIATVNNDNQICAVAEGSLSRGII
jgi:hypothetical protein